MDPNVAIVIAAAIAAIPASIAAVASVRNGRQMKPNGGSSLRDQTNRIEETLVDHGKRLTRLEERPTP